MERGQLGPRLRARIPHDEPAGSRSRSPTRFKDSMGDPSYMAGGGLKRRFFLRSDDFYVDLGGVAFLMTREQVNGNKPFPGVLPAATFGFKRVAVNLTYMPEAVVDRVTNSKKYDPIHGRRVFPATQARCQPIRFRPPRSGNGWLRAKRTSRRRHAASVSSCGIVGRTVRSPPHSNAYDSWTRNDR